MANRYASQPREQSPLRTWFDAVVACAPMTSLAAGLGLGGAGYAVSRPGMAASGALVCAAGLYVERLQARSLRRRRRAERLRSRHEVTELRRTIAQLRQDVGAFQRALHDTEAVLAARSLPLLLPVPAPARSEAPAPVAAPLPAPVRVPAAAPDATPDATPDDEVVVVGLADVEAQAWVQTSDRPHAAVPVALPARQFGAFTPAVAAVAAAPAEATDADALVYAALAGPATGGDDEETTRRLAYAEIEGDLGEAGSAEHGRHVA